AGPIPRGMAPGRAQRVLRARGCVGSCRPPSKYPLSHVAVPENMSDWHVRILQGLRVVFVAMVGAALAFAFWRLAADTTQPPNGLLTITSGFLVATLSIMIVVYNLQWSHFDKKDKSAKIVAGPRTVLV